MLSYEEARTKVIQVIQERPCPTLPETETV